jgi:SOS-response transcriptional repressor LexA
MEMGKVKTRVNDLGHHLKLLRIKNNLTMTQTAEVTGITQGYISQIENGIYTPSAKTLAKLARAYNVPEIHLLRKAGIVQLAGNIIETDPGMHSFTTSSDPLMEVSDSAELAELLKRGLASLELLADQLRQRSQVAQLTGAPVSAPAGDTELSAEMCLPVYDANWQPLLNGASEPAGYKLPAHFCGDDSEAFVLAAGDGSMAPRIMLGDWVVVSPASQPANGQIVAINDRNVIQLRTYLEQGEVITLLPLNPEYAGKTLVCDTRREKVEIVGRVLRVVNRAL